MSWRFPKHLVTDGRVTSVDEINENFLEPVEELGGSLNEHNFSVSAIPSVANMAIDSAFVYHYKNAGWVDHFGVIGGGTGTTQELSAGIDWAPLFFANAGDISLDFVSPTCLLWIIASWQLCPNSDAAPGGAGNPGCRFAVRLDGQIIPETIIGGVEEHNDKTYDIRYGCLGLTTSVVVPVPAGQHSVAIVCKTSARNASKIKIENRDLIVLEMRR